MKLHQEEVELKEHKRNAKSEKKKEQDKHHELSLERTRQTK